jgi:hypothetical protein
MTGTKGANMADTKFLALLIIVVHFERNGPIEGNTISNVMLNIHLTNCSHKCITKLYSTIQLCISTYILAFLDDHD